MTQQDNNTNALYETVALAARYCAEVAAAPQQDKEEFVSSMCTLLPRLYTAFGAYEPRCDAPDYLTDYVDEEYYNAIRGAVAALMGEDDTYLETFHEDMKYSDTPIAASVSEGLADIFQDLYNFTEAVKESDGEQLEEAYALCRENFRLYWSHTLCNTLRPLNALRYPR